MPNSFLLIIAGIAFFAVTWFAARSVKFGEWVPQLFKDGIWWGFFLGFVVLLLGSSIDLNGPKLRLANILAGERFIDLQGISPKVNDVRNVYHLDTDGDGENEWVVFYQLDNDKSFGAAVYDTEPCRYTEIHTYPLIAEENDYLAEELPAPAWVGPEVQKLNKNLKEPALVVFSPDGLTLSLFRWNDPKPDEKCDADAQAHRGYQSIGYFRASGRVEVRESQIAAIDRLGFERSQLAVEHIWKAGDDDTFLGENGRMAAPFISRITFTFDDLDRLQRTYYPEKAVLAFYLTLFKRDGLREGLGWKSEDFLSADLRKPENQEEGDLYDLDSSTFGLDAKRGEMRGVRVLGVSYLPNKEAEQAQQRREVTIVAVGVDGEDGKEVGKRKSITWEVVAEPNSEAAPFQVEWKLNRILREEIYEE